MSVFKFSKIFFLIIFLVSNIYSGWDWENPVKLAPPDCLGNTRFGAYSEFSLDVNVMIISGHEDNSNQGAVWVYGKNSTGWDFDTWRKL